MRQQATRTKPDKRLRVRAIYVGQRRVVLYSHDGEVWCSDAALLDQLHERQRRGMAGEYVGPAYGEPPRGLRCAV